MKRRETLKTIVAGSIGSALIINGCATDDDKEALAQNIPGTYGRTPEEAERDRKLMEEQFFNEHELATLAVLCDIIIPADEVSGSATDAGVLQFIEFIVKDMPRYQLPLRGGLMWLDHECLDGHDRAFKDCSSEQQIAMINRITDEENAAPEDKPGASFFSLVRNLVATGFFTSETGIRDLDYRGNVPNFWDGVPEEVLKKHGLSYDARRMGQYVRQQDADKIPTWDEKGNITG